ncbi:MAG: riboflavin biosynthesis protein RibF [Candidatus Krumholzibacteria bacterium]|nr:riboflavin biosynthesis protein RibF [Candidatus Krumholzibacteria bacterium]
MAPVRIIGPDDLPAAGGAAVVTIGVFDGVHAGHQAVIGAAVAEARQAGLPVVLVTFDRHPLSVTHPERSPDLLTTLDEKISLLRGLGLDAIFIEPFDRRTALTGYHDYIESRLIGSLRMRRLVVGYDFHLGRGREGGSEALALEGRRKGFGVTIVPPVVIEGTAVSSTRIRRDVLERRLGRAARFLTRPYFFDADVTSGEGFGRELGFPTANACVAHGEKLVPPGGVYAVLIESPAGLHGGMMNVGSAPTVRCDGRMTIEVHLFDFEGDLYGSRLRVHCVEHIRDERRFDGPAELRAQLMRDRETASRILEKKR